MSNFVDRFLTIIRPVLSHTLVALLCISVVANAAQITRQHSATISNGSVANASDLNDEFNSLVNAHNDSDNRLTALESGNDTLSGNKTFSGNITFSGNNTHTGTESFSVSADPGSPSNGMFWYNSTSNQFKGYVNGATQQIPDLSVFNATKANPGHILLPNGLEITWGTIPFSSATTGSLTFERACSATPYVIQLSHNMGNVAIWESALSSTAATVTAASSSTGTVFVTAICAS